MVTRTESPKWSPLHSKTRISNPIEKVGESGKWSEANKYLKDMDYSLAALKLLCVQLKDARQIPSGNALSLGGILFQRAWLQGVLVANDGDGRVLLDDGTGFIELLIVGDFLLRQCDIGLAFSLN